VDDPAGRLIAAIETAAVAFLFAMLVLVGLVKQLAGHFSSQQFGWAEDLMSALLLWLVMVGSVVAAGRLGHFRLRIVESLLPAGLAMALRRLAFFAAALVSLVLAWHGLQAVLLEFEFGRVVFGCLPLWMIHAIVPASFAVMGVRFLGFAALPPPVLPARQNEGQGA
jgi:C4-dicarboxylate transporter, DctQ subunit